MSIHSRWFLLNEKEISTCFVNAKGSSSCEAFNHLKWDHFCATNSCLISALHPALASPSFAFHFIYLWYPFPLTWSCHSDPTLLPLVGLRTGTRGSSGGMCWSWWVAGWVDGWGDCPGRRQDKSICGGRGGEDEGAGSPGPAPVSSTCPGPAVWGARETLPRMPSAESGLLVSACQQVAVWRPCHLEADFHPSDGKTEVLGAPTPSPMVPWGLKCLFLGSIGEARQDVGPDQNLHAILGGRNLVTQTHNNLFTSPVPSLVQGMGKKCHTWC